MTAGLHGRVALIGGPARVGKTTLARRVSCGSSIEVVHLDHLLHAVKAVASESAVAALSKAPSIDTHSPGEWLREIRERDRVLWDAARAYTVAAQGPLLLEGGLWPDWVRELPSGHTAVFLVDTADSAERLVHIARSDDQNWMARRGWSDEKIRRWAAYNALRSETIADSAHEHGYPVFDIRDGMTAAQDQALRVLTCR